MFSQNSYIPLNCDNASFKILDARLERCPSFLNMSELESAKLKIAEADKIAFEAAIIVVCDENGRAWESAYIPFDKNDGISITWRRTQAVGKGSVSTGHTTADDFYIQLAKKIKNYDDFEVAHYTGRVTLPNSIDSTLANVAERAKRHTPPLAISDRRFDQLKSQLSSNELSDLIGYSFLFGCTENNVIFEVVKRLLDRITPSARLAMMGVFKSVKAFHDCDPALVDRFLRDFGRLNSVSDDKYQFDYAKHIDRQMNFALKSIASISETVESDTDVKESAYFRDQIDESSKRASSSQWGAWG